MIKAEDLEVGTQIVYIPDHAQDEYHSDCEEGFVTQITSRGAFCRYWNKDNKGVLRTIANSEHTRFENLIIKATHLHSEIDVLLRGHGYIK